MPADSRADIAVIGAGIIGLSCAYELARTTDASIVVFDKGGPAFGTTGGSAGVVCLHESHEIYAACTALGHARVSALARDHDFGYQPWGALGVYYEPADFPPQEDAFEKRFRAAGGGSIYDREILDRDALLRRYPWIRPDRVLGGAFYSNQGYLDPYRLVSLYEQLAVATGRVRVHWSTPVLQLRRTGDRVTSVVTRRGAWQVGEVLNAGGPWGAKVAALAGSELPLTPQRIQVCVATGFDDGVDEVPLTGVPEPVQGQGVWCRGEVGGTLLLGQHRGRTTPGFTVDPDHVNRANDADYPAEVARVYRQYWRLPNSAFLDGWCCVYGMTADGFPIVSRDVGVDNLWHAVGLNGHGITCHAGVAEATASLLTDGRAEIDLTTVLGRQERMDLTALDMGRFARGELIDADH